MHSVMTVEVVMTADEVRAELEKELGSPFAETTWERLSRNYVRDFLEDQRPDTWLSLREVAEDLFEYEKQLRQELGSGDGAEPGTRNRRLGQRERQRNKK